MLRIQSERKQESYSLGPDNILHTFGRQMLSPFLVHVTLNMPYGELEGKEGGGGGRLVAAERGEEVIGS